MPRARVGVALLIPEPLCQHVDGLRRALGDDSLGRLPAHLTLVPPVNVREDRMADALAVLRHAAAETRPFRLQLGPPDTFLPVNPVLYLGVDAEGADLAALHGLRDRVFRDPLERTLTWPFVPHVTIADEASPDRINAALSVLRDFTVEVTFDRVHLLEEGPGRVWSPIADAPFGPPAVVGRGGLPVELSRSQRLDPEAAAFAAREWAAFDRESTGGVEEALAITARRDGRVVGTATGRVRGASAHLSELIVERDERRTGVGSHLLAAFLAAATELGARTATVRSPPGLPAEAFYRGRGWVEEARVGDGEDQYVQWRRALA